MQGIDEVVAALNRKLDKLEKRTLRGLYTAGLAMMKDSMPFIPVVTGNLRNSMFISWPGGGALDSMNIFGYKQANVPQNLIEHQIRRLAKYKSLADKTNSVFIGFTAAYAVWVHENPRAGKTGGRSPKGRKYYSYSTVGQYKFFSYPLYKNMNKYVKIIKKKAAEE